MPIYALIREALLTRQQVVATYNGHVREMCPHVLGETGGVRHALFYQFGGTSSQGPCRPGSPDNWRCIPLHRLTDVSIRPGDWHTTSIYARPTSCVSEVDVQV